MEEKLTTAELEQAKLELSQAAAAQNWLEVSRLIGTVEDPRKPIDEIIVRLCNVLPNADPETMLFHFEADEDAKVVYYLSRNGTITALDLELLEPTAVAFRALVSPVKELQMIDLNNAKYDVIGKKKLAIARAMNNAELKNVLDLYWAAKTASGEAGAFTPDSGEEFLTLPKVVEMLEAIEAYGDKPVLVCGSEVYNDLFLTDYKEDKNQSVRAQFKELGIEPVKVTGSVTVDGSTSVILNAKRAILVNTETVNGKPAEFIRKNLSAFSVLNQQSEPKSRIATVIPAIPTGAAVPKVKLFGYGEFQAVLTVPQAASVFTQE